MNSTNGFLKMNGNTNSIVKGAFYSNKTFSDQWTYGIAAYQIPIANGGPYVTYDMIKNDGNVISTNGSYKSGTPSPIVNYLVQGASGGGGNNYTGSKGSYDNFTACPITTISSSNSLSSGNVSMETNVSTESSAKQKMQLIPNPASNYITLSFVPDKTGNSKLVLYTFEGRKVLETNFGNTEAAVRYQKTVDVSKLVNGIYLAQLWNEGKVTTRKIIISR
jgi:hypothetical protein